MREVTEILRDITMACAEAKEHVKTNRAYDHDEVTPICRIKELAVELPDPIKAEKPKAVAPTRKIKPRAPKP